MTRVTDIPYDALTSARDTCARIERTSGKPVTRVTRPTSRRKRTSLRLTAVGDQLVISDGLLMLVLPPGTVLGPPHVRLRLGPKHPVQKPRYSVCRLIAFRGRLGLDEDGSVEALPPGTVLRPPEFRLRMRPDHGAPRRTAEGVRDA